MKFYYQTPPFGYWIDVKTFPVKKVNFLSNYSAIGDVSAFYCGNPVILTNSSTWIFFAAIDCKMPKRLLVYNNQRNGIISPSLIIQLPRFIKEGDTTYPQIKLSKGKDFLMIFGITKSTTSSLAYL